MEALRFRETQKDMSLLKSNRGICLAFTNWFMPQKVPQSMYMQADT